jgi:2-iminobutanoate/2-iminopropanoate deaminase
MTEISTKNAPAAVGPYSQAVKCGDFIFLSGQIPLDPETGLLVESDIKKQTTRVLENIKAVMESEDLSLNSIVKTTIFLTDITLFSEVNAVYAEYFQKPYPARSTVQVVALPRGALIEIEAIASC